MNISDFDYLLPEELIAQYPLAERGTSRLMVINRAARTITHETFDRFASYMRAGDCVVVNNTKVIPARLLGIKKDTGARIELFLLACVEGDTYWVLSKPAKRLKIGTVVVFGDGILRAEVIGMGGEGPEDKGKRLVRFEYEGSFEDVLSACGTVPLPPYIKRAAETADRERYQTVYAEKRGAVAAPTAGLHFTREVLDGLRARNVNIRSITLHVGAGTFRPVEVDEITKHTMDKEAYEVSNDTACAINAVRQANGRIISCGTTVTRTLESIAAQNDNGWGIAPCAGATDLFIYPPYTFNMVDALLTNFHLPRSTLLMLATAFGGHELIMRAYREAVEKRYRFYSYGDAMLIL